MRTLARSPKGTKPHLLLLDSWAAGTRPQTPARGVAAEPGKAVVSLPAEAEYLSVLEGQEGAAACIDGGAPSDGLGRELVAPKVLAGSCVLGQDVPAGVIVRAPGKPGAAGGDGGPWPLDGPVVNGAAGV